MFICSHCMEDKFIRFTLCIEVFPSFISHFCCCCFANRTHENRESQQCERKIKQLHLDSSMHSTRNRFIIMYQENVLDVNIRPTSLWNPWFILSYVTLWLSYILFHSLLHTQKSFHSSEDLISILHRDDACLHFFVRFDILLTCSSMVQKLLKMVKKDSCIMNPIGDIWVRIVVVELATARCNCLPSVFSALLWIVETNEIQ